MPRGWHNHSREHAMAAKGIRSRRACVARGFIKDRVQFPSVKVDYTDPEEIFISFWVSSLERDFSDFDFGQAFNELRSRLRERLAERAYLSYEDFKWYHTGGAWREGYVPEDWEVIESIKNTARVEEVESGMGRTLDERLRKVYQTIIDKRYDYGIIDEHWLEMLSIYKNLKSPPEDLTEKIFLMDRIIHVEHDRGNLWEEESSIRVEQLRREVEKTYRRHHR